MKIWKWNLEVTDRQTLEMPTGAEVLTVQVQNEVPQLWALCHPMSPKERRIFAVYGTGQPISHPGKYIATFQLHGGGFVGHVFEI